MAAEAGKHGQGKPATSPSVDPLPARRVLVSVTANAEPIFSELPLELSADKNWEFGHVLALVLCELTRGIGFAEVMEWVRAKALRLLEHKLTSFDPVYLADLFSGSFLRVSFYLLPCVLVRRSAIQKKSYVAQCRFVVST